MSEETGFVGEKRRHPRFAVRQMIEMAFARETFFSAEGLNLSEGGMLCRTEYPIEPLTKVYVMLTVPVGSTETVIRSEGTVIHTRAEGNATVFGVSFDELDEDDVDAIRSYRALTENQ